jgi:hypothetical protein
VNHYEVLGVPMGADPAEIRRAYLRLARRHHPDRHVDADAATEAAARRRMAELNEAWEVLGSPGSRRRYDEQVRRGTASTGRATVVGPSGPAPGSGWHPRADDTGWMSDFEAWRNETDELPSDEPYAGRGRPQRSPVMVLPVGLFAIAITAGCVGIALQARPLMAVAFIGVALSATLFVMLPVIVMSRSRDDE